MSSSNLTSKLYEMAEKELTEFENSLDTVKKAIDAAYELSVKRDILSYIENDLPDEITDPDMQTAIENLIETGSPLAIYYDEWLHNEYDNRMEAISMTADDVYSIQQKKLLDLDHNSYCFTVISFDNNDKIAVADYVGKDDPAIYDFDEFTDYAARQNNDEVEVDASFYVVGSSGESDPPDEKQLTYINNHLEEIIREATLLESNTFTVDITEIKKELEEDAPVYDEKYNAKVQNFLEAQSKVNNDVTQFFKNKISDILLYSFSEKQIFALTEAINKVPSDEGKNEIAKHFIPQEGAALYDIMCNNPIENELKIIGISPSEIVPKFISLDNGIELMWKNVSVKIDWNEYAKACFDVAEITAAINSQIPEYTDKINDVEQIADKIQDAIDNTELNIERNEHSVSQER